MAGRIVLFGATGYTGRLTADALVARGDRPVLAARTRTKVEKMAAELGGLESAVADVADPASVRALLEPGDVIVATVGPFARFGDPAVEAAITPAPPTSTRPASPPSSAASSSTTGRGPRAPGPGW